MGVTYLDCSSEVSEIRSPPSSQLVWLADDINDSDWRIELPRQVLDEINQLANFIQDNPLQMLQRRVDEVSIPECSKPER